MDVASLYLRYLAHPDTVTDSRKVTPECIFFALKGESFNGNAFAAQALENGAAFAVVDQREFATDPRIILVEDVLKTMQELALHHRKQLTIPVIAITGTNGKTTTKELINAVLSGKYRTLATCGNLNNHIGVPITLLSVRPEHEIAIIEMGANHQGEIDMLCRIALPGYGLITNIGKAHLDGFGGYEGVISAKTEMYRFLRENNGTVFINGDDELLLKHAGELTSVMYATTKEDAYVTGKNISAGPMLEMDLRLGSEHHLVTRLFGSFNASNAMAAACIGKYFGVPEDMIVQALEEYQPLNNRSQVTRTEHNRLFLDAYNANPSSMELAIRNFAALPGKEKVYILGDMLELGEESNREHEYILSVLEEVGAEKVFLVGPVFLEVNKKIEWPGFGDSDLARMWFEHHRLRDADILIKGSRGIRMEKIVEEL